MVASDTVVGLVGAGILLVALVGVFVYESQQGQGGASDLETASYSVDTTGSSYEPIAGTGTQLPQGAGCAPNPPATQCTPQGANVAVQLAGLPMPGSLRYVVFIEGSPDTRPVGEAQANGDKYSMGQRRINGNFGSSPRLALCLEPSASATTCTWKVATFPVSGTSVTKTAEAKFITSSGNHTLTFTASGSRTNVDARLDNVQNKTGYTYRGWMVKDDESGRNYTFIGNFTADGASTGGEVDGRITGSFAGSRTEYHRFIVTIEQTSASIGIRPAGPAVIVAEYNAPASPSLQK